LLLDQDERVREAARQALGDLGGREAGDLLIASLPGLSSDARGQVYAALAAIGDERELVGTRQLALDELGYHSEYPARPGAAMAFVKLAGPEARDALVERMLSFARTVEVDRAQIARDPNRVPRNAELKRTMDAMTQIQIVFDAAGVRSEWLEAQAAMGAELYSRGLPMFKPRAERPPVVLRPLLPRSVPRVAMTALTDNRPDTSGPSAKFGGEPDWLDRPRWPLTADGELMMFFGQLPLPGNPQRVAYIFFDTNNPENFVPLGDGNALLIQPGAPPQTKTVPRNTGPSLPAPPAPGPKSSRTTRGAGVRYVELTPGADPPEWTWPEQLDEVQYRDDPADWRKIGGTPLFLQGDDQPPGEGWEFAFQFDTDWAGRELADSAVCYGFTHPDGRGALIVQSH
jgi:hypothetical protein